MVWHWLLLTLLGHHIYVQGDGTFVCPSDTGVYPHPDTNTRFYRCVDGKPELHICTTGTYVPGKDVCLENMGTDGTTKTKITTANPVKSADTNAAKSSTMTNASTHPSKTPTSTTRHVTADTTAAAAETVGHTAAADITTTPTATDRKHWKSAPTIMVNTFSDRHAADSTSETSMSVGTATTSRTTESPAIETMAASSSSGDAVQPLNITTTEENNDAADEEAAHKTSATSPITTSSVTTITKATSTANSITTETSAAYGNSSSTQEKKQQEIKDQRNPKAESITEELEKDESQHFKGGDVKIPSTTPTTTTTAATTKSTVIMDNTTTTDLDPSGSTSASTNQSQESEKQKKNPEPVPFRAEMNDHNENWDHQPETDGQTEELLAEGKAAEEEQEEDEEGRLKIEVEEPFICPNESGFFRHPTNCSRFYWCIQSMPTAMFCSEGTAFDPKTSVCSWAVGKDGCGGRLAAPTHQDSHVLHHPRGPSDEWGVNDEVPQPTDDVDRGHRHGGLFRRSVQSDVTEFVDDVLHPRSPPERNVAGDVNKFIDDVNLEFHPRKLFKRRVDGDVTRNFDDVSVSRQLLSNGDQAAESWIRRRKERTVNRRRRQVTGNDYDYRYYGDDDDKVNDNNRRDNGEGKDDMDGSRDARKGRSFGKDDREVDFRSNAIRFQCPGDGFYADPLDCSVFYHCSNGKPYRHQCQPGTAFNKDKLVCSWPLEKNGCGGMLSVAYISDLGHDRLRASTYKDSPQTREDYSRIRTKRGDNSHMKNKKTGGDDSSSSFRCPDSMNGYYPDPQDCVAFYHCADGRHHRYLCANGTAFNLESGVCTWPLSAQTGCGAVLYRAETELLPKPRSASRKTGDASSRLKDETEAGTSPRHRGTSTEDKEVDFGAKKRMSDSPSIKREVEKSSSRRETGKKTEENSKLGSIKEKDVESTVKKTMSGSLPVWARGPLFKMADDEPRLPKPDDEPKLKDAAKNRKSPSSGSTKKTVDQNSTEKSDSNSKNPVSSSIKSKTSTSGIETPSQADSWRIVTSTPWTAPTTVTTTTRRTTPAAPTTSEGPATDTTGGLPAEEDIRLRKTSAWPWESVERKRKVKTRADHITTKIPLPTTSGTQAVREESEAPTTAAAVVTTVGTSSASSTSATNSTETGTTPSNSTSTTMPETTTLPMEYMMADQPPKAETYKVSGTDTDFRCPSPTGHFRDPMNCAIYYHCADNVAFRKDCPAGKLYDIKLHRCLLIPEVKDCRLVDESDEPWQHSSIYPEVGSFHGKVDISGSYECEALYGYFKNNNDCTSYIECIDGVPYPRRCMAGTVFDSTRSKCTWGSLVPECSTAVKADNYQAEVFQCPTPDGYYRDPASCSNYFHCIDGSAIKRVCDPNNFFDPRSSQCRWAHLVSDCDPLGQPVVLNKVPIPAFVCPLPTGHYRDPTDCSVFYHCLEDIPYRGSCRRHHAFDEDSLKCVPRREVPGCQRDHAQEIHREHLGQGEHPAERSGGTHLLGQADEDWSLAVSEESSSVKANDGMDSTLQATKFRCPKAHGLFRDPYDCSVFYHCFSGRHFRHQCQFGTVFSTDRSLCTWPSLVPDCHEVKEQPEAETASAEVRSNELNVKSTVQSLHDHQQDAPVPVSTASTQNTQIPRNVTASVQIDQNDATKGQDEVTSDVKKEKRTDNVTKSGDDVIVAGSDVTVAADDFTIAGDNVAQEKTREAPVVVSGDASSLGGTFDYDLSEYHTPDPSTDGLNNFIVEAPLPVRSDAYIEFICPQIIFDQYFRDPLDCTRFHRCVKGVRFTFDCPRGTFFDAAHNICDFQERVPDCDHEGKKLGSAREPIGSVSQVSFPMYIGDGGEYMSQPAPELPGDSALCPDTDGLFPHPASCSKFVYCARGTPLVLTCPGDLLYNMDTLTCDYGDKIVCQPYDK